jgi:trehalose 6-phosphate phosphatase
VSHAAVSVKDMRPFFREVAAATSRILLIDYDGTIAPFHANRSLAVPYPGVATLLDRIAKDCNTRFVVLTGGSATRVPPLLGLDPPPETWGSYGLERLFPDGRYEGVEITDQDFDALMAAEDFLTGQQLGQFLEISPGGVAVHWRGLKEPEILEIRSKAYRILSPLVAGNGLVIAQFDGGMEIRVRSACPGDAVRSILLSSNTETPIAYLGDDSPDEDAFRLLNGRGLTALVRQEFRHTAAEFWLHPPDDLIGFLKAWVYACGGTE